MPGTIKSLVDEMTALQFTVLDEIFTLHRLAPTDQIQEDVFTSSFCSITKTEEELSIVCDEQIAIEQSKKETDWACIKTLGPLPFEMTGVLVKISTCLAAAGISIFVSPAVAAKMGSKRFNSVE